MYRFGTAPEADQAKQILETTTCPLLPRDRQLKIGFPLRKINHNKHSFEQLRRRALAHSSHTTSHAGPQPPADNADSMATPLPRIDRRKENQPPMETTSSSGIEHEMADTAALARRTDEATNIKAEAKHHQPGARKPASMIVPAVPDIHKINRLLIKQKHSNTFSQLQDFTNEDPADHPSTESKILTPRSSSPEHSKPVENSPSKKEATDNEDESSPHRSADPTPSFQRKTSKCSQGDDELYEDSSPPKMDQRHESPSDAIEAEPTAQSSEQIPIMHDNEDPAAQTAEGVAKPTASEQIPIMHDSADPAADTAEGGRVPTGDNSGQAVEQDVTRDIDSGAKGQPGEQDASRDNTSGMTDQPEEHDTTQDNTSGVAGQPVEQDATQDNPTGTIRSVSFGNALDTNTLYSAAVASKAARNKKKNLKRKEKKEREKREADQEVNSSSATIASSSTAFGTGAVSFRSERPLDFHAPVALQPGQVHDQPAASSLSQLAHEYHGTFGK